MKHWAELDENNIVVRVLVVGDDKNIEWLVERFGGTWLETSPTEEIRKNYAGVGYTYDPEIDVFIPLTPFDSWVLNKETYKWEAPVERPSDGKDYVWDETILDWVDISHENQ